MKEMVPFFVVDRPMSLNLIKTFFATRPDQRFGLMTHALVSENFRDLYARFPADSKSCWLRADKSPCQCHQEAPCTAARLLRQAVIKIVDCGVFAREQALGYENLFDRYEEMKADYGIMKDVIGNSEETLRSAKEAVAQFNLKERDFELVLVAQGRTSAEYLESFKQLHALGVGKIAIGGLLNIKVNSARYASAKPLSEIDDILGTIREHYPDEWIFVLGCYHPRRHDVLAKHKVVGSDYKGWIFNYTHRLDILASLNAALLEVEENENSLTAVLNLATKRNELWQATSKARKAYSITRNTSPENALAKAKYRKEKQQLIIEMQKLDESLSKARIQESSRNGLSKKYKENVERYLHVVNQSDQEVRFEEVHKYFSSVIIPRFQSHQSK